MDELRRELAKFSPLCVDFLLDVFPEMGAKQSPRRGQRNRRDAGKRSRTKGLYAVGLRIPREGLPRIPSEGFYAVGPTISRQGFYAVGLSIPRERLPKIPSEGLASAGLRIPCRGSMRSTQDPALRGSMRGLWAHIQFGSQSPGAEVAEPRRGRSPDPSVITWSNCVKTVFPGGGGTGTLMACSIRTCASGSGDMILPRRTAKFNVLLAAQTHVFHVSSATMRSRGQQSRFSEATP